MESEQIKVCPECGGEYRMTAQTCADCGGPLEVRVAGEEVVRRKIELPPETPTPKEEPFGEAVLLEKARSDWTDDVVIALQEANIPFARRVVAIPASSGAKDQTPQTMDLFYVHPEDEAAGRAAIDRRFAEVVPDFTDHLAAVEVGTCPACGSELAEGDTECPECGLMLGESGEEAPE